MTELEIAYENVIESQKKLVEHLEKEVKVQQEIIKLYEQKCVIYEDTLNKLTASCDKLLATLSPKVSEPISQPEPAVM